VTALEGDIDRGLTAAEAASRLSRFGPNEITGEEPPSVWVVALAQLRDPMNLMLVAVTVVSFLIDQVSTGIIVGLLIVLNVVLGARQELKARASVDALSNLQVPQAKALRDGSIVLVPAIEVVPGTSCRSKRVTWCRRTGGSSGRRHWRCRRRRSPARARPLRRTQRSWPTRTCLSVTAPTCCSRTRR
jgi:hypothetical protein